MIACLGRTGNLLVFGGAAVWGLLLVSCVMTGDSTVTPPQIAGATFVGSRECAQCHENVTTQFYDTTHAQLIATGTTGIELGCESCHGPASLHVRSGGEKANARLVRPVGDNATIVNSAIMCANCHQDVQARFNMTSHHPLKEGAVGCTTCHDAHGSKQTTLTSTTALCTSCHQAVRGPHVHEHGPVAESCANCHNPHGSPNRKMLTLSQPMLCLQCHTVANVRHGQTGAPANGQVISEAVLRGCTNCHNQIHGSSQDEHLRY